MRNYKNSDYALNRYSQGIIYKFADGIVEVTLEAFLRDNPDKTEEDFAELKALSDEIYYQQDRQEQRTSRHDVSINGMEEMDIAAVPPIDAELIRKSKEEKALEVAKRLLDSGKLIPAQRRRFLLHFSGFFYKADCQNGGCPPAGGLGQLDVGGEEAEKIL